ncbi:MAG: Uncharacterized protein G01um10145_37 [Microgenomates group bacterium Gr01-1014_5]|nr:MAG: Uncharacterized protein G01um10145_37 [Microgenomates group bacterium Gr01-1014_5]
MAVKSHKLEFDPPLPLATLKSYAEEIFTPIRRGECVSTIWVPMAGRRVRNKFIISYPELFKSEIGNQNYLLVYVEPLELTEESHLGFFKLLAQSVAETFHNSHSDEKLANPKEYYFSASEYSDQQTRLKSLLKEIIAKGIEIVLFIGEFDELNFADSVLYNNLKAVWASLAGKLHFVFLLQKDLTKPEHVAEYGDFNEVLMQNVVYVPLLLINDIDYLLDYFSKELSREFSPEERNLIIEVCGGHPFLIKACTRIIAFLNGNKISTEELRELLISHYEPRSACQRFFDLLSQEEQQELKKIVSDKVTDLPSVLKVLMKLGLVVKNGDYWMPFGQLFESAIKSLSQDNSVQVEASSGLTFQEKNGAIFIAGKNVEDKFTRQEYEVLRFLLSDPEKLRSRDEIGEAMWGKLAYDKYSDWAIDQAMSKIRKKLKKLGADKYLITVRGRGYKLATFSES